MGSTRQLNRSLGLSMVVVVVITNILGSGVYKKVAPMASVLHSPGWIMVCWVLGGIISLKVHLVVGKHSQLLLQGLYISVDGISHGSSQGVSGRAVKNNHGSVSVQV